MKFFYFDKFNNYVFYWDNETTHEIFNNIHGTNPLIVHYPGTYKDNWGPDLELMHNSIPIENQIKDEPYFYVGDLNTNKTFNECLEYQYEAEKELLIENTYKKVILKSLKDNWFSLAAARHIHNITYYFFTIFNF